jgi:hypothetical protein
VRIGDSQLRVRRQPTITTNPAFDDGIAGAARTLSRSIRWKTAMKRKQLRLSKGFRVAIATIGPRQRRW